MTHKTILAGFTSCALLLAGLSPAMAAGWSYTGPHGGSVTRWGAPPPPHYYHYGYSSGAVAAAGVVGLATGLAIGATTQPPPPPPVIVAPPPPPLTVYVTPAPGYYYAP